MFTAIATRVADSNDRVQTPFLDEIEQRKKNNSIMLSGAAGTDCGCMISGIATGATLCKGAECCTCNAVVYTGGATVAGGLVGGTLAALVALGFFAYSDRQKRRAGYDPQLREDTRLVSAPHDHNMIR